MIDKAYGFLSGLAVMRGIMGAPTGQGGDALGGKVQIRAWGEAPMPTRTGK